MIEEEEVEEVDIIFNEEDENIKEPLSLLTLPNGIISLIFREFLILQDISKLDIAYCNHKNRDKFLNIICDDQYVQYNNIKLNNKNVDNTLIWFSKRKINIPSKISIDWCDSITLIGITGLVTNNTCNNLISLNLRGCKHINDDCIIMIVNNCHNIQILDLSFSDNITNIGISEIGRNLQLQLQSLSIERFYYDILDNVSDISDLGIIDIAKYCTNLHTLNINGCKITNEGLYEISHNCPNLKYLDIFGCPITNLGVIDLANHCSNLTYFQFGMDESINNSIIEIAKKCKKLETLAFAMIRCITDDTMIEVARNINSLKELYIRGNKCISDIPLIELVRNVSSNLLVLDIQGCKKMTDNLMIEIGNYCSNLTSLFIRDCNGITDLGVISIVNHCLNLKSISIGGGRKCENISDISINEITNRCLYLQHITICFGCSPITDESIINLIKNSCSLKSITFNYVYNNGINEAAESYSIDHLKTLDIATELRNLRRQ